MNEMKMKKANKSTNNKKVDERDREIEKKKIIINVWFIHFNVAYCMSFC
jgi:hypothetical protein